MLSPQFQQFCTNWLVKAEAYNEGTIEGCCDKFFTLFVVFNRLYAEATFELARREVVQIAPNRSLPDRKGATEFTLQFIGQAEFDNLSGKIDQPVRELIRLIDQGQFYIKLSVPNGGHQPGADIKLLQALRSRGKTRALAVLDAVYSIRCNLFHGHKAFDPVQIELLRPTIHIMQAVIEALLAAHNKPG